MVLSFETSVIDCRALYLFGLISLTFSSCFWSELGDFLVDNHNQWLLIITNSMIWWSWSLMVKIVDILFVVTTTGVVGWRWWWCWSWRLWQWRWLWYWSWRLWWQSWWSISSSLRGRFRHQYWWEAISKVGFFLNSCCHPASKRGTSGRKSSSVRCLYFFSHFLPLVVLGTASKTTKRISAIKGFLGRMIFC